MERPRVTIAISSSSGLSGRLAGLLDRADIEVDQVNVSGQMRELIENGERSVLLIDRAQLPDDPCDYLEEILCDENAPSLVIVSDSDDPLDRARMLASGAAHVVDASESDQVLRSTLSGITDREVSGGADGPEIRGNDAQPQLSDFLSRSNSMQRFVSMVEKVTAVDCSLLITGETGVGKERLARAIHSASQRTGPFVGLNCGALPDSLLESQLFGHVAGAFTGASNKHKGFFEQAVGGTVFLDEIGEVPLHLQVKLLTVLQRHEVQPLGSETTTPVDVRVIAATNRDPKLEVKNGNLREDLFYRLNVVHLQIPPLRNRVEDVPDLVGNLINFFRCDMPNSKVEIPHEDTLAAMMAYPWPGNIRELVNVIERAMILGEGPELLPQDLPPAIQQLVPSHATESEAVTKRLPSGDDLESLTASEWRSMTLKEFRESTAIEAERLYLERALRQYRGDIAEVARHAKVGTRSIYDKMRKHGLSREDYCSSTELASHQES